MLRRADDPWSIDSLPDEPLYDGAEELSESHFDHAHCCSLSETVERLGRDPLSGGPADELEVALFEERLSKLLGAEVLRADGVDERTIAREVETQFGWSNRLAYQQDEPVMEDGSDASGKRTA